MRYTSFACLLLLLLWTPPAVAQDAEVSAEQLAQWMEEVSNWGRWGDDDELGALNLITPEKRRQAAALVREGLTVPMAFDIDKEQTESNPSPLQHTIATFGQWAGDTYTIEYHGYTHSHIDALTHIARDGQLYNGYPQDGIKPTGAEKLGIQNMRNGIVSRGVLVDIPRLKGVPYLEPGTAITVEDLDAWEAESGVKIEPGDVLLIRTGRWVREAEEGPWNNLAAGLHASTASWLHERDVAVLGCDGVSDMLPSGVEGQTHPIHLLVLNAMGMPILDNLDLEALAQQAARLNRWTFFFVALPLPVPGGTGSPLNPIGVF